MGSVWDRAVAFLGDRLSLVLPVAIFALFVPASVSGSLAEVQTSGTPVVRLALGLVSIAFAILSLWGQLVIAALALGAPSGPAANAIGARRLLPAIGLLVLIGLAVTVVVGVQVVALAMLAGVDLTQVTAAAGLPQRMMTPGAGGTIALLFAAELVLLLWLIARLAPLTAVIVAERRGIGAFGRAFRLTRGLTWRLMGVILLYVIVTSVAVYAAQTVFGSVLRLATSSEGTVSVAGVLTAVIVAGVNAAFTVLAVAFCAMLYAATAAKDAAGAPRAEDGI